MGNARMRAEQINYGASNVKVALDDLDPKDLIALSARMDTIEAWKATVKAEEKTGASVEYTNALALDAVSLSAEIEASQDLHGQSAPYVGGAGKNKLPMTVESIKAANTGGTWSGNSYTHNGVTYTIQTDSGNNITGFNIGSGATASGESYFNVNASLNDIPDGTYILNGCPSNGGDDTYKLMIIKSPSPSYADKGNGITVIKDNTVTLYQARIVIANGYTIPSGGLLFKPMLRLSTESDATFAPWENKCPISGRTSVTITDYDSESNTASVIIQLGQTVYGGTLNVTTGVMTIDRAIIDMGDFTYSYNATDKIFYATLSGVGDRLNAISTVFVVASTTTGALLDDGEFMFRTDLDRVYLKCLAYDDATQFKTAMTGQKICYELATPQTIQLTPTQLTMLKGYNRLSSDGGGDITVKAYTGAPWGGDEA